MKRDHRRDELRTELEELGLSPYEARVLLALLSVGSATNSEIEAVAKLPRTSAYRVLNTLAEKRLAQRLPVEGPAVWAPAERESLLDRIYDAQADTLTERLGALKSRAEHAHELLMDTFSETHSLPLPFARFIHGASQLERTTKRLMTEATDELLLFGRPPYTWRDPDGRDKRPHPKPSPVVLEMLARGVRTRVLYVRSEWGDAGAKVFRAEQRNYIAAGMKARISDRLPIKLIVIDRRVTLANMADQDVESGSYPTTIEVEHPGYAEVQAEAFERYWEKASPVTEES